MRGVIEHIREVYRFVIATAFMWILLFFVVELGKRIHLWEGSTHVLQAVDVGVDVAAEMQTLTGWGKSGAATCVAFPGQLS